jgi:hypothetical protein
MEDLDDEVRSEIAGLLVEANPQAGLSALQRILEHLPRDQLLELKAGRRHIVWALEKLAWLPETFVGAARLLLSLAEAENEEWGNNATGIWIGLFGTHLGATAVPALERHKLVEEALESSSRERQLLAVDAIGRIFSVHEIRTASGEHQSGRVVPPEWHPRNWQEDKEVRLSGLRLLDLALDSIAQAVREAAKKVLLDAARELPRVGLADEVLARLRTHGSVIWNQHAKNRRANENRCRAAAPTAPRCALGGGSTA